MPSLGFFIARQASDEASARRGKPEVDAVLAYLGRIGALDAELRGLLRELADDVPTGANAVWYARDVAVQHRRRQTALKAERVQWLALHGAEPESIAEAARDLAAVVEAAPLVTSSHAVPIVVRMSDVKPSRFRGFGPVGLPSAN